ncbi:MAG: PEP-CTERM sorting domain-containing protein [Verrucomicrobia bacterium]|nr:PEP-CTERM sorting domain-containing protein [Verrucomicrobiota bacterium]
MNTITIRCWRGIALTVAFMACSQFGQTASYEWNFNAGNLAPTLGNGAMTYADAESGTLTSFGNTGGGVPNIGGEVASFMHVPAFANLGNGYHLKLNDTAPNGGGDYVNQYTIIFDILSPGSINWTPFFNTAHDNGNDADFYLADDGSLGIGPLGYSSAGVIAADTWYRVAFAADLAAGTVSYYVNGTSVYDRTGGSLLDGRFALYSNQDVEPSFLLFNEGDTSGQYTHELYISSVAVVDWMLSPADLLALGGPNAQGILPVPEPSTVTLGLLGLLALAGMRLRRILARD